MGLTMSQRRAVSKVIATRYKRADKAAKGVILDELCATTGWHRNHARKALIAALRPQVVGPTRKARVPKYDEDTASALRFCWAVLGAPTGKRLAPMIGELVPTLRRFEELKIGDDTERSLISMSAATTDRRLKADRAKMMLKGRSHTKPGSLLQDAIAIRTWAQWDDAVPGFVEIDLVGHEGGNAIGDHAYTLTAPTSRPAGPRTAACPTRRRSGCSPRCSRSGRVSRSQSSGSTRTTPSEFINWHLLRWCEKEKITFTRSRSGNSNDGAHVEQKNWAIVRTVVGYHRYDTTAELVLLNQIWVLQSQMSNYFSAQQKLISKVRDGSKVTKKYDTATTAHRRAERHDTVTDPDKAILADTYPGLNPAAIQRQIQALTADLLRETTGKAAAHNKPTVAAHGSTQQAAS